MLKTRNKPTTLPPATATGGGGGETAGHGWEMRPGGMLVQKRNPDPDRAGAPPPPPPIRVRIKYNSVYHEINISPQATFGELKKMLSGPTGLHHQDQKIMYKDKERDSKAFLDIVGVKDKSKMVLVEDPISQEKRLLEMRKNAKTEKASKAIADISFEVDRLGGRVSALETVINKGGRVLEKDLVKLIELLMNELLKLDGILADGDAKLQRKMQVRRVQKYVETLDVLKIKNSINGNGGQTRAKAEKQRRSSGHKLEPIQELSNENPRQETGVQERVESLIDLPVHQYKNHNHKQEIQEQDSYQQQQKPKGSGSGPFSVSTNWETFETSSAPALASAAATTDDHPRIQPRFNWEFFD
ncbi:PREDICTED: BAG family molecular chaperone regulator 1-like [Tarenaya hassleriana]|uniref:BAG family molecular chaperone regulator 1-like n=1 Tax=Tarenaya hassleriana TaxID=28532 RepID=UPI00053C6BBD|nr:PREDICTED: BAG family molecular chaperone regulator 1-like [Tarenaya hassleriana]